MAKASSGARVLSEGVILGQPEAQMCRISLITERRAVNAFANRHYRFFEKSAPDSATEGAWSGRGNLRRHDQSLCRIGGSRSASEWKQRREWRPRVPEGMGRV